MYTTDQIPMKIILRTEGEKNHPHPRVRER